MANLKLNPARGAVMSDPIGPENAYYILTAVRRSNTVIAAWGANAKVGRSNLVRQMLINPCVFGLTENGFPKHPLYIPNDEPYSLWEDFQSGIEAGES